MTTDEQAMTEARRAVREMLPAVTRMHRAEVMGRTEHSVRVRVAVTVEVDVPTRELVTTQAEPRMTRRQARDAAMARLLAGDER